MEKMSLKLGLRQPSLISKLIIFVSKCPPRYLAGESLALWLCEEKKIAMYIKSIMTLRQDKKVNSPQRKLLLVKGYF